MTGVDNSSVVTVGYLTLKHCQECYRIRSIMRVQKTGRRKFNLLRIMPKLVTPFVDMLWLRSDGKFDELNGGLHVRLDEAGEVDWHVPVSKILEGSFSTKCTMRVREHERILRWNPSRLGREDNALGVEFDQALIQADRLMKFYDQPPWEDGVIESYADGGSYVVGTEIERVDMACLLMLGDERKAQEFMRHFYMVKLTNNQPRREGITVYHGAKRKRGMTYKAYPKGKQIELIEGKKISRYQREMAKEFTKRGIIRFEIQYGPDALDIRKARQMRKAIQSQQLAYVFNEDVRRVLMKMRSEGDIEKLTFKEKGVYYMHRNGENVKAMLSPSQFYRYKKAIWEKVGYDIAHQNVVRFPANMPVLQPVFMTPDMMPEGYKHPTGEEINEFLEKVSEKARQ